MLLSEAPCGPEAVAEQLLVHVALQVLGPLRERVALQGQEVLQVLRVLPALEGQLVLPRPPLARSSWPECWSPALPRPRRCLLALTGAVHEDRKGADTLVEDERRADVLVEAVKSHSGDHHQYHHLPEKSLSHQHWPP